MMRALFAAAILIATTSMAAAEFHYRAVEDNFDGKLREVILASAGKAYISLFLIDVDVRRLDNNVIIVIKPEDPHVCGDKDDEVKVSWIVVSAGELSKPYTSRWLVADDNESFSAATLDPSSSAANLLLKAMKEGDEIRFRYTDACGDTETMIFPLDGFRGAVAQMERDAS